MAEHSEMVKADEHLSTRRRTDSGSAADHEAKSGYSATLLRQRSLGGRGNSQVRAQVLLNAQRTHGNRAVQRQADEGYEPTLPFWASGPLPTLFDYGLYSVGRPENSPGGNTTADMVQEHIARIQGVKAFHEGEQARKHDVAIDDAQRAITGLPPDWFTWGEDPPGTLETPQYDDVSPALNPWELQEAERQREFEASMR